MSFDATRIDVLALAAGVVIWLGVLAVVWLSKFGRGADHRETDFRHWKASENRPTATFSQFLASERVPRIYLSKAEATAAATAFGLLVLFFALRDWGVFGA